MRMAGGRAGSVGPRASTVRAKVFKRTCRLDLQVQLLLGAAAGRRWLAGSPAVPIMPRARRRSSLVAGVGLLGGDLLQLVFSAGGGLGHTALCRCSCVCRRWLATSCSADLWVPLLRRLTRSMGSDPFAEAPSYFAAHGGWKSLFQHVYGALGRLRPSAAARTARTPRANTLWDVVCALSPQEAYTRQHAERQRRCSVASEEQAPCPRIHGGAWLRWEKSGEITPATQPRGSWVPLSLPTEPLTPVVAAVHIMLDWVLCQQHDPLERVPPVGNLLQPYHSRNACPLSLESLTEPGIRGFNVGPGGKEWARHDLTVAGDCFLGLAANCALGAELFATGWFGDKFRLVSASPTAAALPIGDWAPLSIERFGQRRFEAGCQTVEEWGRTGVASQLQKKRTRTVFVQPVSILGAGNGDGAAIDPERTAIVSDLLAAFFTGLNIQVLDGREPWQIRIPPRFTRAIPPALHAYTVGVNRYDGPQFSVDAILSQLRGRAQDVKTGISLLPSALAVIALTSVDLYSAHKDYEQYNFLWAHGASASALSAPKHKASSPPVSFGVLSLSRGAGRPGEPWVGSHSRTSQDDGTSSETLKITTANCARSI